MTITVTGISSYVSVQYKGTTYEPGSSFEMEYGESIQITLTAGTDSSGLCNVKLNAYTYSGSTYGYSITTTSFEYVPNNDATIEESYGINGDSNSSPRYGIANITEEAWDEPPSGGESAQTCMVDGTVYHIKGGTTLIDGTAYKIKKGKTMIDGTVYTIGLGGSGGYRLSLTKCNSSTGSLHITVTDKDGNKKHEYARSTNYKGYAALTVWADLLATDSVTVNIYGSNTQYVWLNGSQVASGSNKVGSTGAEYTITGITGDIQIAQEYSSYYYAKITMPA